MKSALILIAIACIAYASYEYVRISRLAVVGTELGEKAVAFESTEGARSMLVLGDSTAVGVGSPSELSVPGRISLDLDASVENNAVSGAKTRDIAAQFALAQSARYDLVLIQIGANDVIRFSPLARTSAELAGTLDAVAQKTDRIVLLTAGKVGAAPFFPRLFGWAWTYRAAALRNKFMSVAEERGVAYVDLFTADDHFADNPDTFYAPDGLHLSGEGYAFWYEETKKLIDEKWPEL